MLRVFGGTEKRGCEGEALTVALCGNPNVGKSTLFNELTGLRQHTGNWAGKTVALAEGTRMFKGKRLRIVDLPGAYSLNARSREEEIARDFITDTPDAVTVIICDATALERSLGIAMQVLRVSRRAVLCVNLMDEAKKRGIEIDIPLLEKEMGVRAVGVSARRGSNIDALLAAVCAAGGEESCAQRPFPAVPLDTSDEDFAQAGRIAALCVRGQGARATKLDAVLTGRWTAAPFMLLLLALVFYITLKGANYPSGLLSKWLFALETPLMELLSPLGVVAEALVHGLYRVLAWVVAVMLPPMAIFFPLFTLLEDLGYLPRVAFNLDGAFSRCNACGKQALTMCMGFGCNAAGVVGCRIIDSPRERLIAVLTNAFVPCNGRFPTLAAIMTMFFVSTGGGDAVSALMLTGAILLGVATTLGASKLLSLTVLRGMPSSFTLELPPFRLPRIGQVVARSLLDRTLFVLGRAVSVAAPAGLLIYILANLSAGDGTVLQYLTNALDPFAQVFGLDGVILMAFILGLPANEIVLPIAVMAYMAGGSLGELPPLHELRMLLVSNGWTATTAVCTLVFSVLHWPCATTLITVKKETGHAKWALLAFLLPTIAGFGLCFVIATVSRLLGLS